MSEVSPFEKSLRPRGPFVSSKITEQHLERAATLYVRQSTSHQLREHKESTARQYALTDRLRGLGWPKDQVIVIDDDLGISGTGKAERPGFRRMLKLVTDEQVGIVLGLEMSRLARNSKDWNDLFEVCAIFNTLIADEDGVFDPHDPNDRLVLGLKGIISEMEQHTMKVRLERGRLSKAQRGELFHDVPVGYMLDESGLPQLDPDESARHAMHMFFDLFESLGSSHALFHHLAEHHIKLPFRDNTRDRAGEINWRLPGKTTVYGMLKHPLYAGAYGYGREKNYARKSRKNTKKKHLPPEQWKVLIKDRHPAYITWQQYENNQKRLSENNSRGGDRSGPVRGGSAILSGIVFCTCCGRRISPHYPKDTHAVYSCNRHRTIANAAPCHSTIRCATLDDFVTEKVLEVLEPAGAELSLQVIEDEAARRAQLDTLYLQRVQQGCYAVDLAERRYKQVDSTNRLVASTLEQDWETALAERELAEAQLHELRNTQLVKLTDVERQGLVDTCDDIAQLWRERATVEQRKQIVRLLLGRVEVEVHDNSERVSVRLHWCGGFESCHQITRTVMQFQQLESYDQLLDRTLNLVLSGERSPNIAAILESEGFHSPRSDTPISAYMVQKLLMEQPHCRRQLIDPPSKPNHWRCCDLAAQLGIPEKRLKDWVTRGWATATQRPFGRVWVFYADDLELKRLQQLVQSQTGQGTPGPSKTLRTPAPALR